MPNATPIRVFAALLIAFLVVELVLILGYEKSLGHQAASKLLKSQHATDCPDPALQASTNPAYIVVNASSFPHLDDGLPVLKVPALAPAPVESPEEMNIVSCPKFEAYDKRAQTAKEFEDYCKPIPTNSKDFKLNICQSPVLCGQGYFKIERIDKKRCAKELAMDLSWNINVERYLKEKVGPDAFYIQFDGPERAAFGMWTHLGDCVYKHPFRLINSGAYTVKIMHAFQSFDAINELKEDWSVPIMKNLIENYKLDICPHCPVLTAAIVDAMDIPICSRYEPTQGIYLQMTMETEREKYKFDNYHYPYIYVPLGCRFDQRFELHGNDSCISARKYHVLVNGDSQSRLVWDQLDLRLAGDKTHHQENKKLGHRHTSYFSAKDIKAVDLKKRPNVTNRFGHSTNDGPDNDIPLDDPRFKMNRLRTNFIGTVSHMNMHYEKIKDWDDEMQVTAADKFFGNFDAILVNVGHWPASGNWAGGHFSIERYVDLIEYASNFMLVLNSRRHIFGKKAINYVWEGINAFKIEPDSDGFAAKGKDWRIDYRLRIFSDFAERTFRRRGIKMMNSFDMTLPWAQESWDKAHLYNLPALDAQVDELLHKWNICNVSG
ncbi:hypothetical protein BC830DRAFT_1095439 [Chytriomyces sp. MP71]|nr:hypothetical protein BC830DRAFT_1095439 [Chytriomyces sp. MP71]